MAYHSRSLQSIRPYFHAVLTLALALQTFACIKRARNALVMTAQNADDQRSTASSRATRININTAPANELETLPGIGKGLAERIVEHREKFGPFRRPEHLIMVRGISDKRFRALQHLITVD